MMLRLRLLFLHVGEWSYSLASSLDQNVNHWDSLFHGATFPVDIRLLKLQ